MGGMENEKTDALLTEIHDLLKAQQETLLRSHKMQVTGAWLKFAFYAAIVIFSIYSTYYFYSTIVAITSGTSALPSYLK